MTNIRIGLQVEITPIDGSEPETLEIIDVTSTHVYFKMLGSSKIASAERDVAVDLIANGIVKN